MSNLPKKTSTPRASPSVPASEPVARAVRRPRGRPPRISREVIIQKSLEILATTDVEDFMVKTVAQELGTASMAIYNYFDSREDLLVAVADHVCLLFKAPKPKATWQESLLAWLWGLKKHCDHYPVIPSIIGIGGRISAGWVGMTVPVSMLLHDEVGLRGKQLAMASYLCVSTAVTMIRVVSATDYRNVAASVHLDKLTIDDRQREVYKKMKLSVLKDKEVLDALFAQLIRGIEVFL